MIIGITEEKVNKTSAKSITRPAIVRNSSVSKYIFNLNLYN